MIVGLPKEIKDNENRVGLVPAGVRALVSAGHQVFVEHDAGVGSGIPDEQYTAAGAKILGDRGRGVPQGRHDREGEGAGRPRVSAPARGPDPLHVPPSRAGESAHGHAARAQGLRRGLRDDHGGERLAAAADADVGGRRPDERPRRRLFPSEIERRPRRPPLRRAGSAAGGRRHHRRRRRRNQRGQGRGRDGRRRHDSRRVAGPHAGARRHLPRPGQDHRFQCAHARGGLPPRGPADRRSVDSRSGRAEARLASAHLADEEGRGRRGRGGRPGRLLRDDEGDDPFRPRLHGGRRDPLLRREHAGSRARGPRRSP